MEKTYISPDIIVVEMENNLMAEDVISKANIIYGADDSGETVTPPTSGSGNGTSDIPEDSKDNAFDPWSTWDD